MSEKIKVCVDCNTKLHDKNLKICSNCRRVMCKKCKNIIDNEIYCKMCYIKLKGVEMLFDRIL